MRNEIQLPPPTSIMSKSRSALHAFILFLCTCGSSLNSSLCCQPPHFNELLYYCSCVSNWVDTKTTKKIMRWKACVSNFIARVQINLSSTFSSYENQNSPSHSKEFKIYPSTLQDFSLGVGPLWSSISCFACKVNDFFSTCACLEVVCEFQWRATYFCSLRTKLNYAPRGMPKWVWSI